MMDWEQMDIFECFGNKYVIDKPVRMIEMFAGIGSQALSIKNLGIPMEHHRVYEIDKYSIASYNAIHNTNFTTTDIQTVKGEDLGIVDKLKYIYIGTYSFPCTDISNAGRMLGYAEGSGTRSSLLWEVKRILNECEQCNEGLPQILLCENVPQIHSKSNMVHFQKWLDFLKEKNYSSFWSDLNAKNYGVPQSRNRTFIVSILGDYSYKFPTPQDLEYCMDDFLEDGEVDEKYYLKNDKAKDLIVRLIESGKILTNERTNERTGIDLSYTNTESNLKVASCIRAKYDGGINKYKDERTGVLEIGGVYE